MITDMERVEVMGLRARLPEVLAVLQGTGQVHLDEAVLGGKLRRPVLQPREAARVAEAQQLLARLSQLVHGLPPPEAPLGRRPPPGPDQGPEDVCLDSDLAALREAVGHLEDLEARDLDLVRMEERFRKYLAVLDGIESLGDASSSVVLPLLVTDDLVERRRLLAHLREIGACYAAAGIRSRGQPLATGRRVETVAVPPQVADEVRRYLKKTGIAEIVLPQEFAELPASELRDRIRTTLAGLPERESELERAAEDLIRRIGPELAWRRSRVADWLARIHGMQRAALTDMTFRLVGWIPARAHAAVETALATLGEGVAEMVALDFDAAVDTPPTRLENPGWSRPAETFLGIFPPPRYGSIDPTTLFALTFPFFFGWMVGDAGYGTLLLLGLLAARRRIPESARALRDATGLLAVAAVSAIVFGVLFGEYFGHLGAYLVTGSWHGRLDLWMPRTPEHLVDYLLLSLGLGIAHMTLSLGLGIVDAQRQAREGRHRGLEHLLERLGLLLALYGALSVAAGMSLGDGTAPSPLAPALEGAGVALLLVASALLAYALPGAQKMLFAIEAMGILSNVVSYSRMMAVGAVGVVLADIANAFGRMGEGAGPAILAFHLAGSLVLHALAFVLVVFDPLLQALRLHYVEFFSRFFEAGGRPFDPMVAGSGPPGTSLSSRG